MNVFYFIRTTTKKGAKIRVKIKDGKRELYGVTPLVIEPKYWNPKGKTTEKKIRESAEFIDRGEYRNFLTELESHLQESYLNLDWYPGSDWLAETISKFFKPEDKPEPMAEPITAGTLLDFVKTFIEESKTRINHNSGKYISESTIKKYTTCYNLLKDFTGSNPLNFEDITQNFYKRFTHYLTGTKNHKLNTVGKQIAILKGFLNEAAEQNLHNNTAHKSRKFKILTEDTDSVYLNESELETLFKHDFSENKKLERVRDLFLIGAWTGCRFGDFTTIRPENIKNGYIHVEQEKTGESVIIPVHSTIEAILQRYNGRLPEPISNQKFNDYIKDVAEAAKINTPETIKYTKSGKRTTETKPKFELISSHTARRSFATNLYKSGFSPIGIMKITGHRTERAFLKYIKVTPEEHAERLKEHWNKFKQNEAKKKD